MPSEIRGSDNFDSAEVIAQEQTWQDVSASRSSGVEYTNDTGRPIMVCASHASTTTPSIIATVDSLVLYRQNQSTTVNTRLGVSFIVPAGSTYQIDISGTFEYWNELR